MLKRLTICCAAAVLSLAMAAQSLAQCGDNPKRLQALKAALSDMSSSDPAVIDRNLKAYTHYVDDLRKAGGGTGGAKNNALWLAYQDALEFWREKKANSSLGDMVEIHSGARWSSYLKQQIGDLDSPVGTWNWWNGYTVTFNRNGGATYQGKSLADSGTGRWDKTGTDSFHVHWLKSNTNDYFTLSSDGAKLSGKFDGKPGVSTRRC